MLSDAPVLTDTVAALRCPICRGGLSLSSRGEGQGGRSRALVCLAGHSFDAARQGYFNLLTGKGTAFEADTAEMVAARHDFLSAGHYAPLQELVSHQAASMLGSVSSGMPGALKGSRPAILDAGTGTGHYLRKVLDTVPEAVAVGLDISKFALRRAARLNPDAVNLTWDIWQPLPIADSCMDLVMVVFAPRNAPEFARVMRKGGTLLVVTPLPGHLAEIAERTGMLGIEENKEQRLTEAIAGHFVPDGGTDLEFRLRLEPEAVVDAAVMGPAGHHIRRDALRLAAAEGMTEATARFRVSLFKPLKQ